MSTWLLFAVAAQFLFAISALVDKHIVVRAEHIGRPIVYSFYISFLSGFVIVIAPFGIVTLPSLTVFFLSLAAGVTFFAGIFHLYSALRIAHASDVAPTVGAISAVATVLAASIWLGEVHSGLLTPIGLLVIGTALISRFHFTKRAFGYALVAGIMLGLTVFLNKLVYNEVAFVDGFFWTRMMNVVVALMVLLVPAWRYAITHAGKHASNASRALVVGNKTVAGCASVLMSFAVSAGPVSVVNALSGLQFVFLFALTFLFGRFMPGPRQNTSHVHVGLGHTAAGVACIVLGLGFLYASQV